MVASTSEKSVIPIWGLLVWYIISFYLAVAGLGLQQRMERSALKLPPGVQKSIATLDRIQDQEWDAVSTVERWQKREKDLQTKFDAANENHTKAKAKYQSLRAQISLAMEDVPTREGKEKQEDMIKVFGESEALAATILDLDTRISEAKRLRNEAIKELEKVRKELDGREWDAIDEIQRQRDERANLRVLTTFLFNLPGEFLTLVLALAMGVFGSTIHITRVYLGTATLETDQASWYLFRPLLGAAMALAVYIFFKAGVLVFSQSQSAEGSMLNPFVIAFLGIISGLFSEHAYNRLDRSAREFFRPDTPADKENSRWAVGVLSEMADQGRTRAQLAEFLKESLDTVDQWVEGRSPVTPQLQQTIAFWLGKTVDELFSDPNTEDKETKPQSPNPRG
jgi:hypothetical protein